MTEKSCLESQEITVAEFIEQRGSFGEKEITVAEYIKRRDYEADRVKRDWETVTGIDGNPKTVIYYPDDGTGVKKIEFEILKNEDGSSTGKMIRRYPDGRRAEAHNVSAANENGFVLRFRDDENYSRESIQRFNGYIPHGEWESFYPNGQTDTLVTYNMGKVQGIVAKFAENGEKIVCRDIMPDGSRKELDEIKTVHEFMASKKSTVNNLKL